MVPRRRVALRPAALSLSPTRTLMDMHQTPTILIIGLGELGGTVLELLARAPAFSGRIVAADIDADLGLRKVNSARQGAILWDAPVRIDFMPCDLTDVARTTELLHAVKPDLIFNATTLATWWLRDLLPEEIKAKLHAVGAGSGLWSAGHAALTYNLMRAVRGAGLGAMVINCSYPDAVNPALAKAGLAPALGIGNGGLLIAPFRQVLAERYQVSPCRIAVYVVAHHFHAYNILVHGNTRGLPFYMRLMLDADDVTEEVDRSAFLASIPDHARIPAAAGATWIVAASALRTILAFLTGSGEVVHAPGPNGLVGGYPVRVTPRVEVVLPRDIDLAAATALNEKAQKAEGIERFEDDGTIVLTETAVATLKDVFGFECRRYPLAECFDIARELGNRLRSLGERHGLDLRVH
ncbi:MAG: Rossmann-fold NAD(P)-binding domain-containing protein [Alphaproteobacteria bacterium]